ncbi:MAG: UDP-N-acetylmuramoyl-L-alanine--D-glutamate ligase [Tepidisphaeraceae bacterium]
MPNTQIVIHRGQRITVAGLGRFGGGIEVCRWLASQGAKVLVTDREPAERLGESVQKLAGLPLEFRLGEHRVEDFTSADVIVTSPALPPRNEFLEAARRAGVPVTTEVRLFIERCPCPILGVTGTKGKSTTSAMLGEILRRRHTTWVGGNIGGSLLGELDRMSSSDRVVLELSSYMLEHLRGMSWSPHVAIVTMISPDHLEWHGSYESYVDAKKNILRFQKPTDAAVLSDSDPTTPDFARQTPGRVSYFGSQGAPFEIGLIGAHNQANAQAAWVAASTQDVSRDDAQVALAGFKALPHRLQVVAELGGVKWIDDSIATIPQAAVAACGAFPDGTVIQIVGGYDKHLDMGSMHDQLSRRCKAILTIGALGPAIAGAVRNNPRATADVHECDELARAVEKARALAAPGDVILLSPGCASYDQFVNFEARGDAFTALARQASIQRIAPSP